MIETLLPLLKEFGFPIALCVVLLLTIRHQNTQLAKAHESMVKALIERIRTLEGITDELKKQVKDLEDDRIRRADEYAHSLKDVAGRYASAIRDFNSWMDKVWAIISRAMAEYQPHPQTAPPPPKQPDTQVIGAKR